MSTSILRRLRVGILTAAVTAGVAVAAAPAAGAAPTFTSTSAVIKGDVTGDGRSDRVTLGYVGDVRAEDCAAQVAAGLGSGQFAAPTVLPLQMRGGKLCPDLGVVVRGPSAAQNQLAVTFFEFSPNPAYLVQLFGFVSGGFVPRGHFNGMYQPSQIGSQDFDGDGWGDLWENTDQGSGFQGFVGRRGYAWHTFYSTPGRDSDADNQFFDFNHQGGTDVLVTWWTPVDGSGAAVVDGRTGAVQILESGPDDASVRFVASVIDIDHDAYPDVLVTANSDDGTQTTYRFLNRSQGGRWSFRLLG